MAAPKTGIGLLLSGPSEKSEPAKKSSSLSLGSSVEDSLKEMYSAMRSGDWEDAALHFKSAYHDCADDSSDDMPSFDDDDEDEE